MTVIAYRAGIMACDSCMAEDDSHFSSVVKINRLSSGALLGGAGEPDIRDIIAMLDKIKDPKKLPSRREIESTKIDFLGLLVFPKGNIFAIENGEHDSSGYCQHGSCGIYPISGLGGYAAVGSGGREAIAAMDAGATAERACYIAIKRVLSCREPVHTVRLWPAKRPVKKPTK